MTIELSEIIRPMKTRAQRTRAARRAQPVESRALRSIETVEAIESVLVTYLDGLREAIPQLRAQRRFYDGAWQVGVSADLQDPTRPRRDQRVYSRLAFDIQVDADARSATVSVHSTAFDRDLPSSWLRIEDVTDLAGLERFAEQAALAFARQFYDRSTCN